MRFTTTKADPGPADQAANFPVETGSGEEPVSRRSILSGVAALVPAAALATVAAPAAGAVPAEPRETLAQLIDAHKAAYDRYSRALDVYTEIEESLQSRKERVLVPLAVMPNGECTSGKYELGVVARVDIVRGIRETHESLRRIHCSEWSRVMFPELAAAAERELEASEARALQALVDAENGVLARERDAGLPAAEDARDAAYEEERDARLALALYRPRDADEAAAKWRYVSAQPNFRDCDTEVGFVEELIEGLCGVPAGSWRELAKPAPVAGRVTAAAHDI